MCGRYSLVFIDDLGKRFRVFIPAIGLRSRFNIAPSQENPVIVDRGDRRMVMMQWGLAVNRAEGSVRPINARAETLATRPAFSRLLAANRCLVPASGFFEWKKEGSRKIPYYIRLNDSHLFAMAGLHDTWYDAAGMAHPTYTIVTTRANAVVAPLHGRMPAILREEDEDRWLGGEAPSGREIERILAPCPASALEAYPVSSRVNSPDAEGGDLIRPLRTL